MLHPPALAQKPKNVTLQKVLMRALSKKIALLCLLLTVFSAVGLVTHNHSSRIEAARCSVCVAVRSAAPKAAIKVEVTTQVFPSDVVLDPVSAQQRLISFALRVR